MGLLSNYCGFGGDGIPQHKVDEICAEHDRDYATIQAAGSNPYLHYNWADKKMLKSLEQHCAKGFRENVLKLGATALWKVKKVGTSSLSDSPPMGKKDQFVTPQKKHPRDDGVSPPTKKMKNLRVEPDGDIVPDDDTMGETPETSAMAMSARSGNASTGNQRGYKETPIINERPQYGIPEVMTVTLPWTMYFAVGVGPTNDSAATDFEIRMTSLTDIFPRAITNIGGATAFSQGIFNRVGPSGTGYPAGLLDFPSVPGTKTTDRPQWSLYFMRMYQAYTVLKTEWDITIHNPRNRINSDCIIGMVEEAYPASGGSSGNVAPSGALLIQAENWPDVRWNVIHSSNDGSEERTWTKMAGTYYPGKANKNVRNDEAVQTWTTYTDPTAPPLPSLTEQLHFMVWRGPFDDLNEYQILNFRVHLRITCQLRDLIAQARYPTTGQTSVTQTLPGDAFSIV